MSATSITVDLSGNVGIGTTAPAAHLDANGNVRITGSLGVGTSATGTSGEIIATDDITAFYSDARLKENIRPIDQALEKVMQLNGVYYNANQLAHSFGFDTTKAHVGVLAQEVQAVLPEVVALAPFDRTTDGTSASAENYLTVKYDKIVPLLINAIKEQQVQIAALREAIKNTRYQ